MQDDKVAQSREYTLEEVKKHTTEEDCWIIIRRKVYNVTEFLYDHPAGADILLDCAGTDATEAFVKAAHSVDAEDMLDEYCIGKLKGKPPMFLSPFDVPRKTYRRPMGAYKAGGAGRPTQ